MTFIRQNRENEQFFVSYRIVVGELSEEGRVVPQMRHLLTGPALGITAAEKLLMAIWQNNNIVHAFIIGETEYNAQKEKEGQTEH